MSPGELIRDARRAKGLTQGELAQRLGTTQSAVARLEANGSNPRVQTLARALSVCERELSLEARTHRSSIDETMVFENLRLAPGDRLRAFEASYASIREFALAAARSRGDVA